MRERRSSCARCASASRRTDRPTASAAAEHLQAAASRLHQRLPPRLLLLLARADALLQTFQPPHLRQVLGPQCLCRLAGHVELGLPFGCELGASGLDRVGLFAFGRQAGVPLERLVQPGLGRPLGAFGTGHPQVRAVEPLSGVLDSRDLVDQAGLLLPDCDQSRLQQACDLGGLLADGANLFLTEQIGQQRLDLAIAVGVELALALGGEYRREEGLRAAADALDAAGVRLDASVGYRAIVDTHGPPLPIVVQSEQECLGLAAATHPDDDL